MVNEEKVRLMTKLAIYEEGEGKKNIPVSHYYRSDYISVEMIKGFICATIAYVVLLGMWGVYQMENLMEQIAAMDLFQLGLSLFIKYVVFTGIYLIITYIIGSIRYSMRKQSLKRYELMLKKIEKRHQREQR